MPPSTHPDDADIEAALADYLRWSTRSPPHHHDGTPVSTKSLAVDQPPFWVHALGGKPASPHDVTTVRADASFDANHNGKFAGAAWQVTTPERVYKAQSRPMRRFQGGSQTAELHAVVGGLEQAAEKGVRHILIQTDCQTAIHFLAGTWSPQRTYTVEMYRRLTLIVRKFDSVQAQWVRTKTHLKDVDRLSKTKRRAAQQSYEDRKQAFIQNIQKKMDDPKFAKPTVGTPFYQGYRPLLDPPSCTCYFWTKRVAPALLYNPRNIKHICGHVAAAARDAGIAASNLADLMVLGFKFRRANSERNPSATEAASGKL